MADRTSNNSGAILFQWLGSWKETTWFQLTVAVIGLVLTYAVTRITYLLYFHPLSKYPGPKLAAISNMWYAKAWYVGKYPWAVEQAVLKYGDVVRIAPNELVFAKPKAITDIYASHVKMRETFTKTNFQDIGQKELGITWEMDPNKHREIAKKLHPAFSPKSLRSMEPALQLHLDQFIAKLKNHGGSEDGIEMNSMLDWLSMDIAADMAYNRDLNQIRDMKPAPFLTLCYRLNFFMTILQVLKKFPLLKPLLIFYFPPSAFLMLPTAVKLNRQMLQSRIEKRGHTEHLDYFQQLCPETGEIPRQAFLEQVAGQLLLAGFDPLTNLFYASILFLLSEPNTLKCLTSEVREAFPSYDQINSDSLTSFKYLQAVIQESLRLHTAGSWGLPRKSPGAMIDETYIPKGITCQSAVFAVAHSDKYFFNPRKFCPQRWLSPDHPAYDSAFSKDDKNAFNPFGQGPRSCPGSSFAHMEARLLLAKLVWSFDLEYGMKNNIVWERDFKLFVMWEKPDFYVRFKCRNG